MSTLVILRPLGLGDLLTGIPAYRALARAFPRHHRILAAPAVLGPLALHSGAVNAVHDTRPLEPLDRELHGADIAINLHGRGPESHALLEDTRPTRLVSFGTGASKWRADEHEVGRWCRLLADHGIPADPADLELDPPPGGAPSATVIHPGAASGSRRWPVERFAAVARAERAAGRRVVVTAGPEERGLAGLLCELAHLEPEAVVAPASLLELAAVVGSAARVVCGDTGVAHLATALRVPSVVLFGPVSPAHWGPPDRPWHRAVWAGQTGDPHGDRPDPGLLRISVDEVLAALDELEPAQAAA